MRNKITIRSPLNHQPAQESAAEAPQACLQTTACLSERLEGTGENQSDFDTFFFLRLPFAEKAFFALCDALHVTDSVRVTAWKTYEKVSLDGVVVSIRFVS